MKKIMVFTHYHSHVRSNTMKMFNKLLIYCGLLLGLSVSSQSYALPTWCSWKAGSATNAEQPVELGTADNLVAVNNGVYPSPVNFALANITTRPYGGEDPATRAIICTRPVLVTPRLRMTRNPDNRFFGYPYLQDTNHANYFSFEMTYTTPTGEWLPFGELNANAERIGTPFLLGENASPSNPVEINLRTLNVNAVTFQGYQTAPAVQGSTTTWGTGGTLNYIYFDFADQATPNNRVNAFRVRFYIHHVTFAVKTCAIDSLNRNMTVNLGEKSEREFSSTNIGGFSNSKNFKLALRCAAGAAVTYRVNTATPDTVADSGNTQGLIKFNSANAATGYALQLRAAPFQQSNGNLTPVRFGQGVTAPTTAVGNTSSDFIEFDARYYRTAPSSQATPGTANATITIDVNYQ